VKKTIVVYSLAIAAAAFVLQWLEYQYFVRLFPTEVYVVAVAVLFTVLGIWVGNRLTGGRKPETFERNARAIATLGVSERELEVLELLAEGRSNKEIADRLFVSPNTVKTHLANLYGKLEVSRRTQAIQKARELRMIP
jgi:DNA-binding CsgD family transcriptional regulator